MPLGQLLTALHSIELHSHHIADINTNVVKCTKQSRTLSAEPGLLVIGAGLSRTGTLSSKQALEELLEGPCYHHEEFQKHRSAHLPVLERARVEGWDKHGHAVLEMLQPYKACVDAPLLFKWKEILAANPNAKVLLTTRDFDSWYKSMYQTVYKGHQMLLKLPGYSKWLLPPIKAMLGGTDLYFGKDGIFKGQFEDKEAVRQMYDEWHDDVKATVPAEQLLVYQVKQGWEPLCQFLGVPVPNKPFPCGNGPDEFQRKWLSQIAVLHHILTYIPAVLTGGAVAMFMTLTSHGGEHANMQV